MPVKVGDPIPAVTLKYLGDGGLQEVSTTDLFKGKTSVLFAVPGAFTPSCSEKHLPGYVEAVDALKAKGVAQVVCLSVNDPFVMKAWGKAYGVEGKVFMLPDGNATFTRAMGLDLDGSGFGLGIRSKRYAALIEDGMVTALEVEEVPSAVSVSSAESMLAHL